MLKFKTIKNTIINQKPKTNNLEHSVHPQNCSPLSFKTLTQQQQLSPLRKCSQPFVNYHKFQTDKKQHVSPFKEENYRSDAKENVSKNLYYTKPTNFSDLSFKKIQFAPQTKRKINHKQSSLYTDAPLQRQNSKGTLSFANLLQSKNPYSNSSGKFNVQSQRIQDRQSSISKLKEKLFGMKRIISQKQNKPLQRPCLKQLQTNRDIPRSPYRPEMDEQDIVKVSMREDSLTQQLDMAPFIR